jgi:soluble lytic murein transglycosylase-like protein
MRSRYRDLIQTLAQKHQLDPWLVEAIVFTESSDNPFAIRYEPHFRDWLSRQGLNLTRQDEVFRSISWGLMQVMGQVAVERGFGGHFLSELLEPDVGVEFGCRQLAWLSQKAIDLDEMVCAYNTGLGNARRGQGMEYLAKVKLNYERLD